MIEIRPIPFMFMGDPSFEKGMFFRCSMPFSFVKVLWNILLLPGHIFFREWRKNGGGGRGEVLFWGVGF